MNARENSLRNLELRNPQWIEFGIFLGWRVWHQHREDLEELVLRHPKVFRGYKKGSVDFDGDPDPRWRQGEYFRDIWGCLWYNKMHGLEGQVVEHPLADWKALDTYQVPDLLQINDSGQTDWDQIKRDLEDKKKRGLVTSGYAGRLFDRLYLLRGMENLMIDIATDDPHLPRLMDMVAEYELRLVEKWFSLGVDLDIISFHTDIGMQDRLMISPDKFRQYIKPWFKRIFRPCFDAGAHVTLSSDGCLVEIIDDLVECGVSSLQAQIRANTLAGIEKFYKGKICINLDLDRQMLAFCQPDDIKQQVKEAVERLGSPEGGLTMSFYAIDEDTPLENIEAMCQAGEEYCLANKPDPE